jgi:hypothetical protein
MAQGLPQAAPAALKAAVGLPRHAQTASCCPEPLDTGVSRLKVSPIFRTAGAFFFFSAAPIQISKNFLTFYISNYRVTAYSRMGCFSYAGRRFRQVNFLRGTV